MELDHKTRAALAPAEEILLQRQAIARALDAAKSELPGHIEARIAAEAELSEIEASGALGSVTPATVAAAHRKLQATHQALDGCAAKITGLRAKSSAQLPSLVQITDGLRAVTTDLAEKIAEDFRQEYSVACAVFSRTLSRRAAIEALVGPMDLLPPGPGESVDVGDELGRPFEILNALEAAVREIQATAAMDVRDRAAALRRDGPPYDPTAILEFIQPVRIAGIDYAPGTRTLASTLGAASVHYGLTRKAARRVDLAGVASG